MIKRLKKDEGFTLIELMIVIAIIGVLAAIAIPNFISYRNKSYCTQVAGDAQAVKGAIGAYFSNPARTRLTAAAVAPNTIDPNIVFSGASKTFAGVSQAAGTDVIKIRLKKSGTNKCNIGTYYTSYLGTSTVGGWSAN